MRVYLKLSPPKGLIPYNYQHLLTGVIHKWLGSNKEHGDISLYSFSNLMNASPEKEGLSFNSGSSFFFSSFDSSLIQKLLSGIQEKPEMFEGFKVEEAILKKDPDFNNQEYFYTASPIFIKRRNGNHIDHITYLDKKANEFLTETLRTKMKKVGILDSSMEIKFDMDYPKSKTKIIHYWNGKNEIKNKTNICPVYIKGNNETKVFAWNVGLGNSTGIGFGALK